MPKKVIGKFGGSSLSSAQHIKRCANILKTHPYDIVVVSAIGKTTRRLLDIFRESADGHSRGAREKLAFLAAQHRTIAMELTHDGALLTRVEALLTETLLFLNRMQDPSPADQDAFLSFGERLSCALFRCGAPHLTHLDAREIIITDDHFGSAAPNLDLIFERCQSLDLSKPYITEGFIGSSLDHQTTTLGFEGSDLTAALLARALGAARVDIWTDVRGVYAADPNIVPSALFYPSLSYDQMARLASLGGRVLHERTLEPLKSVDIPLVIRSSLDPTLTGTVIHHTPNPDFWAISQHNGQIHVIKEDVVSIIGEGDALIQKLYKEMAPCA